MVNAFSRRRANGAAVYETVDDEFPPRDQSSRDRKRNEDTTTDNDNAPENASENTERMYAKVDKTGKVKKDGIHSHENDTDDTVMVENYSLYQSGGQKTINADAPSNNAGYKATDDDVIMEENTDFYNVN